MSAVMMLRWLEFKSEADALGHAITQVYTEDKVHTTDLGGTANTREFTDALIAAL
jgi:isocitrate dehydrogenase (NAD+)